MKRYTQRRKKGKSAFDLFLVHSNLNFSVRADEFGYNSVCFVVYFCIFEIFFQIGGDIYSKGVQFSNNWFRSSKMYIRATGLTWITGRKSNRQGLSYQYSWTYMQRIRGCIGRPSYA